MKQAIYDAQTKTEAFIDVPDESDSEFFGGKQVLSADERLDVLEPEVVDIKQTIEVIFG